MFAWNLQLLDGKAFLPPAGGGEIDKDPLSRHPIVITFFWLMLAVSGWGQQLVFTRANNSTNDIKIPAGEVWKLTHWVSTAGGGYFFELPGAFRLQGCFNMSPEYNNYMNYIWEDTGAYMYDESPIGAILVGPTNIVALAPVINGTNSYVAVFEKIVANGNPAISPSSLVIPTSATGDVDVKIEQSADNVTWSECLPGTYNSSTVKRFFRLRAVER